MNTIKLILCFIVCSALTQVHAQSVRSTNTIGFGEISVIELAGNGDIWVGSPGEGVGFFNAANQQWEYFNSANVPEMKSDSVTSIAIQLIGGVEHAFIGTPKGVVYNNINTGWDTLALDQSKDIKGLMYKPDTLMVFAANMVYRYDSTIIFRQNFAPPASSTITAAQTRAGGCGGYWFGTAAKGCFSSSDGTNFSIIDTAVANQKLVDNRINVLTRDNACQSRLVGTKGGFSKCPTNNTIPCQNFTTAQGLPQNDITAIAEDCQGRIWLGTRDSGMVVYDEEVFTRLTTADGLPDNRITTVGMSPQDCKFYIGTKDGNISVVDSTKSVIDVLSTIGKVNADDINVRIYPVPAKDKLNFVFDQQLNANFHLTDINGREVFYEEMRNSLFVNPDVSTLPKGMYFYRLEGEGKTLKAGKVSVVR